MRESEVAQSCLTPSDPMDCSPPGPSVHGIFQARALEWVAIAFSLYIYKCAYVYVCLQRWLKGFLVVVSQDEILHKTHIFLTFFSCQFSILLSFWEVILMNLLPVCWVFSLVMFFICKSFFVCSLIAFTFFIKYRVLFHLMEPIFISLKDVNYSSFQFFLFVSYFPILCPASHLVNHCLSSSGEPSSHFLGL